MATKTKKNRKIKDIIYRDYELYIDGEFNVGDFKATRHCVIETEYLPKQDVTHVKINASALTIIKYSDVYYKMQKCEIFRLYDEKDFANDKYFYAFKVHTNIYSLRRVLGIASIEK